MKLAEDKAHRERIWDNLTATADVEGDPALIHQHELLPCVRKGVAARWAKKRGHNLTDRKSALYFLRGHSAEALIKRSESSLRVVHHGVLCSVDWWHGGKCHFTEIKSTTLSSRAAWELLRSGEMPLETAHKFASWFKQCATYCTAFGIRSCRLLVFFLHGEYAERRRKCPECSGPLEDGRLFKTCQSCGYKSYRIDLRSYILEFTKEELEVIESDVFWTRLSEFLEAQRQTTPEGIITKTTPTPGFLCWSCEAGKLVACPFFGSTEYE